MARAGTPQWTMSKATMPAKSSFVQTYARYLFDILSVIFIIKTHLDPNRTIFGSQARGPIPMWRSRPQFHLSHAFPLASVGYPSV